MSAICKRMVGLVTAAVCTLSVASGAQLVVNDKSFSYVAPKRWVIQRSADSPYPIAVEMRAKYLGSNICVETEAFKGTVAQYADETEKSLPKQLVHYQKLSRGPFRTRAGVPTVRLAANHLNTGTRWRVVFYMIPGRNIMYIVACTTAASNGRKLDPMFDAAIKTFRVK